MVVYSALYNQLFFKQTLNKYKCVKLLHFIFASLDSSLNSSYFLTLFLIFKPT